MRQERNVQVGLFDLFERSGDKQTTLRELPE
jgi:hypothetical protein